MTALELLDVKSKGTITKYLKYRRRIPDKIVLRTLQAITEEEFTEIIGTKTLGNTRTHRQGNR